MEHIKKLNNENFRVDFTTPFSKTNYKLYIIKVYMTRIFSFAWLISTWDYDADGMDIAFSSPHFSHMKMQNFTCSWVRNCRVWDLQLLTIGLPLCQKNRLQVVPLLPSLLHEIISKLWLGIISFVTINYLVRILIKNCTIFKQRTIPLFTMK